MKAHRTRAALSALLGSLSLVLAGCEKVADGPIDNLNGGRITIIGHAGSGFESALNPYPSNTLTSFRRTLEGYNADGIEMDIQLSADSIPMLYHDETLESMTECEGYVVEKTAAEVAACRYRTDFNSHILQDEHLLRLEDILSRYAANPLRPVFDFDLKGASPGVDTVRYRRRLARQLAVLTRRYDLLERITFESGDAQMLLAVRAELPGAHVFYDEDRFERALAICQRYGFEGIVAQNDAVTAEQVRTAHQAGLKVALFSIIRRPEILEAVNKNPDALQTDNILLTQEMVAARR